MNLTGRLKKLEQTAGKGKWCARCRLMLRTSPPIAATFAAFGDAPNRMKKTCQFCGNQYQIELPQGDAPSDRVVRLYYTYDDECCYTDEKAAAVNVWARHHCDRSPEEGARKEKKRIAAAPSKRRAAKPTPEQKLRGRLMEELTELYRRRHDEMKAKHGTPFPHIIELEQKIGFGFYEWCAASHELERWRAWATLERIIFGEPLPETAARIIEYEAKAATEEAEKQHREAERREREQRSEIERKERQQRWDTERRESAQRTYPTGAHRPPPSGQWG